ncbi:Pfs, NACHT and Ankyrin domain protein [Metarhizium guizhouense ARSEF 977]|uniref:Pfs, NACHT and Ankyrin domain protein n=1 Tax=Metarhizium guizhouense (strain ARSEF 977) TaxID=1276136 RepID=A0A0B4HUW3_METGA|nr:Pfs, NACHT and Ankyrin domain protein [Metarhizium guizhouense ARSEF 977]
MASDNALDNPDSYTVAWIAALPIERAAAEAMLDEEHAAPTGFTRHQTDMNVYTWGRVGEHNIVITSPAAGVYGTTLAVTTVSSLLASLPSIRVGLSVGIGGGIARPDEDRDIRLGDVVVSEPNGTTGGVSQPFISGKTPKVPNFIQEMLEKNPKMGKRTKHNPSYAHQGLDNDRLFKSPYDHIPGPDCKGCDSTNEVQRHPRDTIDPEIHYGTIASGNTLIKDAAARDRIVADVGEDCICFEMEAAGLMNHFPCLVIRGICDYADSHKNVRWQRYASATASAYAKELLAYVPAAEVQETKRALEVLQLVQQQMQVATDPIRSELRTDRIKRWLCCPDPSTNANHARKLRHEGTGAWLLGNPVFREWCSGSRQHLWLNGLAGCGKTVLSTTVLDHLKKGNDRLILYFFFDFCDTTKQTSDGMLRSLAFQLYQGEAGSASLLDASIQAHHDGRDQPATKALEDVVCKMLAVQKKASIILDALDESTTRRELLLWMKDIVSRPELSDIQLICTARPETEFIREIPLLIGEENCSVLDKESINADIRSYVAAQLSQRPDFAINPCPRISWRKSESRFRRAFCQLESLARCHHLADIENALASLPHLSRTWPLFGEDFMRLVKHVVRSIQGLRCSGVAETIVEVGEVYGWMIAALRSARGDAVSSVIPALETDANHYDPTFRVNFRLQFSHSPLRVAGQCWQDLFRNPAVVLGYPVRRRQPGQEPGLEFSLYTLAALVGTRRIAVFCGKIFLKGFCTMLVPTKYTGDTVHWHVLFNEYGCRIPFTDSRVRDVVGEFDISEHLMLSGIETARHVVGWCEKVRNYAGSKEANYDIDKSGLRSPDSGFAFDRISISAGKIVTVGASVALGKKDKPARAAKSSDYHKQLEWIDQRFVVLFDPKDRRAWLIDGLSALLHLVRASLAHRRRLGREVLFGEGDVKESDTPHTGKAAANEVLRNRANMDLKIYEKWNRLKTWEQLPDLVGDIYTTLSMIVDIQTDVRTADGFGAKVRISPRRRLEGWDFQQLATGADPLWPRATMLHHTGLGWVDLVRGINAITLFGVGFGEILQPVAVTRGGIICGEGDAAVPGSAGDPPGDATLCAKWARLPRGEDLLATTTPVIRDIMENVYRDTDYNGRFWELFESIYWHNPDKIFENCACAAEKTQCDRVQVLLPTQFPSLFARGFRSPPKPLPNHGAVIFGHSVKFPLMWKSEAGSVPSEGQPPKPQLASSSSHQSDSGLGTSVASSDQGNPSSQAPNQRPSGSGSTHGEPSSLAPSTVSAKTRSGKGSRNVLGRLLRQIRSGTKPSEHSAGSGS